MFDWFLWWKHSLKIKVLQVGTAKRCIINIEYMHYIYLPYRMNMESTNWSCKTQQSQYMKNVTFLTQGRLSNSLLWTWNFVTLSGTPQHLRVLDAHFGSTSFWMDYSIFTNRGCFQPILFGWFFSFGSPGFVHINPRFDKIHQPRISPKKPSVWYLNFVILPY